MTELLLAELLSVNPVLLVGAEVVAVVTKKLPAFVAMARLLAFAILAQETLLRNIKLKLVLFKSIKCRVESLRI